MVNFDTYAAAIHEVLGRFQSQVGSIKAPVNHWLGTARKRAFWVKDGSSTSRRLANLLLDESINQPFVTQTKKYSFKEWIDDDMAEMAMNKTRHYEDGSVETVDKKDIDFHPSHFLFDTD